MVRGEEDANLDPSGLFLEEVLFWLGVCGRIEYSGVVGREGRAWGAGRTGQGGGFPPRVNGGCLVLL